VTIYRVSFEGPPALTLRVDGARRRQRRRTGLLRSALDVAEGNFAFAVAGAFDAVADADAKVRGDLPSDASVEITGT